MHSLSAEDILGVTGPDLVLSLVAGVGAGPGGATSQHTEPSLGQQVKRLLQEVELQDVPKFPPDNEVLLAIVIANVAARRCQTLALFS